MCRLYDDNKFDEFVEKFAREHGFINRGGKKVTSCVGEAKQDWSESISRERDHCCIARRAKRTDLAQPQQANFHLFTAPVNKEETITQLGLLKDCLDNYIDSRGWNRKPEETLADPEWHKIQKLARTIVDESNKDPGWTRSEP